MKKLCTIVVYIGVAGILLSALLKLLHIDSRNVMIVSHAVLTAGIALAPALYAGGKFNKLMPVQKLFLVILWVGVLLLSFSMLFRLFDRDWGRVSFIVGVGMLLLYVVYVIIATIVSKLRINPIGKLESSEVLSSFGVTGSDLAKYLGVYNNAKLPLKITITQDVDTLIAQATDQSAFYLEMTGKNEFKYPKRDIVLEFNPEKNELMLKQHGGFFPFIKEE